MIPDVEPMPGPDGLTKGLARAIRIAVDPDLTDDDLFGISGNAFLATVCANNCNCRDFREMILRVRPTLDALGIGYEYVEGKDEAIWTRIKASIDGGVPVTAWNLFGDFEDALLVGYDEEQDLAYGRGAGAGAGAGDTEYTTTPLSRWKAGGMYGFIVRRGPKKAVDRARLERAQLRAALMLAHRPALEGG